jgi:hypothetical protein
MKTAEVLAGLERARAEAERDFRWCMSHVRSNYRDRSDVGWLEKAERHQQTIRALDVARELVQHPAVRALRSLVSATDRAGALLDDANRRLFEQLSDLVRP